MPDLIVIVPGIMGSVLSAGGRNLWDTSVGVASGALPVVSRRLAELTLPDRLGDEAPDGPVQVTATSLVNGWQIWPSFWTGAGYGGLIKDFRSRVGNSDRMRLFPYDWRLSNRYTARRLSAFVDTELRAWRERSGDHAAQVVLIAHSMGGLVSRYYLEVLGGRERVRRLVTLGTPYSGSVKAIQQLTGRVPWALGPWQEPLTLAARSMPALWQLLPTYRCVTATGDPVRLDETTVPGLDWDQLTDALRFHAEIAEALAANGTPAYTHEVVIGDGQKTPQSITVNGPAISYHHEQRGTDHLGDGTVPRFSAAPPEWDDDARGRAVVCRHGSLPNHRQIRDQLWNIANALNLGAILAPPVELALDVPEVIPAEQPLPVHLNANRTNARIAVRLRDPETGKLTAERVLHADGMGGYSGLLPVTPGIWEVEATAVGEHPQATVRELVVVVDQAATTGTET
ncbi:esterase/lipase family protein [Actinoplanes subglobosus]|uniref:Esterase/lipase family protein n=1 Tax=Actinoplanes subglobosus TaxID=1547892 RepID=A0ABV8IIV0_9ACTN